MSEQIKNMREDDLVVAEDDQLYEFKASMGDPSEVPGPTGTRAKAPGNSKNVVDDPQDASTAVKPSMPPESKTKMGMIQAMVNRMNGMKKTDLQAAYGKMNAAMHSNMKENTDVDDTYVLEVVRSGHRISSKDIDIREDIEAVFANDENLSEEFKEAALTIFEAAVVSKVNEQLEKYVADIDAEINEEKDRLEEEMSEKLDQYLDYVVENWMEDNRLAVEKGIKSELVDDFINGLKDLFNEHYIEIPDDRVDVVEELAVRAEELEIRLDEEMRRNIYLKSELSEHRKADLFAEACENLTENQKEKFRTLVEGIEFNNEDSYVQKLETLKSSYFTESTESKISVSDFDDAEPLEEEARATRLDPEMSTYVSAISRTLKK
jgi:hypothetical protein